jgi:RsiW-degrading membrane proteinase PrsW (M82 family)
MAISAWWVLWAFLGGGTAGILVMAMMFVASADENSTAPLLDLRSTDSPELPPAMAESKPPTGPLPAG